MTAENKQLVQQALDELFQRRDLTAIERYFAPDYRQHNPFVSGGSDGLREFASAAIAPNPEFSARASHVLGDGELVAVRSRYTGFGPTAHVGFDLFRIEGSTIVEHWDCLQEDDSPDEESFQRSAPKPGPGDTESARAIVEAFVRKVLIGGVGDSIAECTSPAIESLQRSSARRYVRLHRVVAEGDLVLTQAEGTIDGQPHALYDLFQVRDGRITGHWGATQPVVDAGASGLGMF